jgi:hypothetical protein
MEVAKSPEQIAAEAKHAADAKAHAAAVKKEAAAKATAEKKAAAEKTAAEVKAKKEAAAKELADAKAKAAAEVAGKKEAEAKAKAEAKAAAAALAAEKKAAAAEKKVKVVQPSKNGITRPRPDGACGKVWAFADAESAKIQAPVAISVLMPVCQAAGLNDATTRTQYARWKTYNGVFGAVAKPAAPAAA